MEKAKSQPQAELNSYKFAKPRQYIPNEYPSAGLSCLDRLKELSTQVGPKTRTPEYNDKLVRLLQASKPKRPLKKRKEPKVALNSVSAGSNIRLTQFGLDELKLQALVDTGSTHCLLSVEQFHKLKDKSFRALKLNMRVAGHVLTNNIIGKTTLPVEFSLPGGKTLSVFVDFLIAHATNGYKAILGADFLYNTKLISSITSSHLVTSPELGSHNIPLTEQSDSPECNLIQIKRTVTVAPFSETGVELIVVSEDDCCYTQTERSWREVTELVTPLDTVSYSISNAYQDSANVGKITGLLRNGTAEDLHFQAGSVVATFQGNHDSQLNSCTLPQEELPPKDCEESLEEEILQETLLVDTTNLDKQYTWKDCEINSKLDKATADKLMQILQEHESVFAKNKLDVGKFPHFTVQLEITDKIPAEQQRVMSEEKADFCDKTFETFERMGLVEECHTPKTISNLHLVPKYEGLRDLTKASTYLAQVQGVRNTQFRIVQDLRRVNSATQNIKRTVPKLPEQIFQKLQGKIVSSMDANQAYWHLPLAPESRAFTCFWLRNRVMQFNRMVQGLASAPACWDQAMSIIFSDASLAEIKASLPREEADLLPDKFEDFFCYWQDDSWIFSKTPAEHLVHLKAVLQAYERNRIKISPQKSTFFPHTFKILGVAFSPQDSELKLDKVKAQSILDWEKPDSLYTLQSRLYALNYWTKFIPSLAEVKYPLNQILRSGIFSWNQEADDAWESIKALVALDIRLTIPDRDEQLLLTTDASKIACSCILWVVRDGNLRVVGCYSKLFSHCDSLKNIHFKETYALVQAFSHFRPYLLNSTKSVVVFTDARSLMWVSRNREYSIACNGLVNKLARIQLEIPHKVYSVPSEVNYLADLFSRAFSTSRFLDKSKFALSKVQAGKVPPLPDPCVLDEAVLYEYFAKPLQPESSDRHPRARGKISTPKPIKSLYKLFKDCTPEEKYLSALRLLQGWDDPKLSESKDPESDDQRSLELNALNVIAGKDKKLFQQYKKEQIKMRVDATMANLYPHLTEEMAKRVRATLEENLFALEEEQFSENLKADFLEREKEISLMSSEAYSPCCNICKPCTVRYALTPLASHCPPVLTADNAKLILSSTEKLTIQPQEVVLHDLGVHLQVPEGYMVSLTPVHPQANAELYYHTGITNDDFGFSLKVFIKNTGDIPLLISPGSQIVLVELTRTNLHLLEDTEKTCGHIMTRISLQLSELHGSLLHEFLTKHSPSQIRPISLPCSIMLPEKQDDKTSVLATMGSVDDYEHGNIQKNCAMAFHRADYAQHCNVNDFTKQLLAKSTQLNSQKAEKLSAVPDTAENAQILKDEILAEMCEKLAVINLDLIKNKTLSRHIFSRAQQSDDYLSGIYQAVLQGSEDFPRFFLKDSVLYKRIFDQSLSLVKYVICLPDELVPSVIHTLHTTLGHPSVTATIKNFQAYYYSRQATKCIKAYVRSCITCSYAGKYDLRKVRPSTSRTLRPARPRQHMYCDLIPMPKGQFSYILFCLDAYSQYVYTVPLRDKTANSVLQGFLQIFSTVGWYEALYLDNETSFVKVAQLLVKLAPISVHYSTPYCHFQNNAENYIKSFKRNFLKILNDSENPQDNKDWALCLPTVTQSLNRQVIQALGLSRDTVHYNCPTQYYPLAELSAQDNAELQLAAQDLQPNVYDAMKAVRDRAVAKSTKAKVPVLSKGQLVFVIDKTPSAPGVSSVLKVPTKGPFRIEKIEDRNATLIDIEDGKIFHSHVELLRPLSLRQYKTLLTKNWDFNSHFTKTAKSSMVTRSAFERAMNPLTKEEIMQSESLLDMQDLFANQPMPDTPDSLPEVEPDGDPPDHHADQPDGPRTEDPEFNSFRVSEEVSKLYKENLDEKSKISLRKKVSFSTRILNLFK